MAMRILIASVGSNGDIHPYAGVGMALAARGHQVGFLVQPYFERLVREAGLTYFQMGDLFDMAELATHPEMMAAWTGSLHIIRGHIIPQVGNAYTAATRAIHDFRPDVVLAHHLCFGVPWAAERAAVPCVVATLSPIMFMSRHDPVVFNPLDKDAVSGWRLKLRYRIARAASGWMYDGPLNRWRREFGLPAGRNWLTHDIRHAPRVLGLWSTHFRPQMPDDPVNGVICGFPWYDRHKQQEHASHELEEFLASGPPPVIFTLGSTAVHVAGPFYRAAAEACALLGRRGMLLTGRREYAPPNLPAGVRAFTYAPYSEVLPRGAATVHHGGIGTTAQSLRAGRPSVVVPFAHDQFDNAARLRRLGVSATVSRNRITSQALASALRIALDDPVYSSRASTLGQHLQAEDGAETAADILERAVKN